MKPLRDQGEPFQRSLRRWRTEQLERFEPAVRELVLARVDELDQDDYVAANRFFRRLGYSLDRSHVGKAFDEEELRASADNFAATCGRIRQPVDPREVLGRLSGLKPSRFPGDGSAELRAFAAKCAFASTVGLKSIPASRTMRFHGLSARLDDPLWWRRQLRKAWSRASEHALRQLGLIRKGRDVYCSEAAVRMRSDQKRRIKRYTDDSVVVNEQGEVLELSRIVERSLANPKLRRGELLTRLRGFDELAQFFNWPAIFVTVTCPSHFHAELASGGRNPRYSGLGVRDAQRWLVGNWARCRALFGKRGLHPLSFRVVEPHHDGTPHWHVLIFAPPDDIPVVSDIITGKYLQEFGGEPGARQKRVCVEAIDRRRGSAVAYLAKYISKNIDGQGVIGSEPSCETGAGPGSGEGTGVGVTDGLPRVEAWSRLHGIRQFQQIGGPRVGLYREMRRLRQPIEGDHALEAIRSSADHGDWFRYCLNVGYRFNPNRFDRILSELWRHEGRGRLSTCNLRFHREENGRSNRYGELLGAEIRGVACSSNIVITRPHSWKLERKQLSTGGGAPDVAQAGSVLRDQSQELFSAGVCAGLGPVAVTVTEKWARIFADLAKAKALNEHIACQKPRLTDSRVVFRHMIDRKTGQLVPRFFKEAFSTGPPH